MSWLSNTLGSVAGSVFGSAVQNHYNSANAAQAMRGMLKTINIVISGLLKICVLLVSILFLLQLMV